MALHLEKRLHHLLNIEQFCSVKDQLVRLQNSMADRTSR